MSLAISLVVSLAITVTVTSTVSLAMLGGEVKQCILSKVGFINMRPFSQNQ